MKRSFFKHKPFLLLLSVLLILSMILPAALQASAMTSNSTTSSTTSKSSKGYNFKVSVTYGFDNKVRLNSHTPFYIQITNDGKDFEGSVQVVVPGTQYSTMYEKNVSLAAGSTKTVELTVPISGRITAVGIRIVDKKGNVVHTLAQSVKTLTALDSINIGILSDNFTSLSYMSGITLFTSSNGVPVNTLIHELNESNFPDTWKSLDLLDIIVITNYSTDKLSEDQLNALDEWIKNGGALIIGTGSTATKVFSGLKKTTILHDYNVSGFASTNVTTSYGLAEADTSLLSPIDYSGGMDNDYYWVKERFESEFQSDKVKKITQKITSYVTSIEMLPEDWFYSFFKEHTDLVREVFFDYFQEYYGYTLEDWEQYGDSISYKIYDNFLSYYFHQAYNMVKSQSSASTWTGSVTYVDAEITNLSGWFTKDTTSGVPGDIKDSSNTYPLALCYDHGLGQVIAVAVDFTLNPLASYIYKDKVFTYILSSVLSTTLYMKILEYYNTANQYYYSSTSVYDTYSSIYDALSSASAPPVLLFIIILMLYLVSIFIIYARLKKKKKAIYYWGAQVVAAFAFALVIFICGFSTRLHNATLRTVRLIEAKSGSDETVELSSVIMPSTKKYVLNTKSTHNTEIVTKSSWWHGNNATSDLNSYHIGINQKPSTCDITIANEKPLDDECLYGHYADSEDHGELTVNLTSTYITVDGTITNNYDRDLEYVFVQISNNFYLLGSLKKGETITVDSSKMSSYSYSSNSGWMSSYNSNQRNTILNYFHGSGAYGLGEFFFGTNNEDYRRALYRGTVISYISGTAGITVGGFAAAPSGAAIQENGKYSESTYDLIFTTIEQ